MNLEKNTIENVKSLTQKSIQVFKNQAHTHIRKRHGNEKKEKKKGQIAVKKEDFRHIEEIINTPDEIEVCINEDKSFRGLKFWKKIDGKFYCCICGINESDAELFVKTMFIKKEGFVLKKN